MMEAVLSGPSWRHNGLDALLHSATEPVAESPPLEQVTNVRIAVDSTEDSRLCELIEKVAQSNQEALAALYDCTASRVFSLARGITRNVHCAEEVTEDVYWQVWRQALRFERQRGPVMAWMLTLARSRALDHLRRRDEALSHPEPETLIEEHEQPSLNPAQLLSTAQRDRCLKAALERLEPLPRQLLALAFFGGLTHEEIAQQTQLPLGSVKSHIRRALTKLQRLLKQVDIGAEAIS